MFHRHSTRLNSHRRKGWLAPILALLLFVVLGLVALVLDRLWLEMAQTEAQAVAEAAALAAARELASDDQLKYPTPDPEDRIQRAKMAAENVAALNRVAGQSFTLNADQGEVLFGSSVEVEETGEFRFIESIYEVRSVRVLAHRSHAKRNPVALFFGGLTKVPAGEVAAMAEATLDNRVIGLQIIGDARIPALPLAILKRAPANSPVPSWETYIEQRQGMDHYRFDPLTQTVEEGRDGIPEIVLVPPTLGAEARDSNVRLISPGGKRDVTQFEEQIRHGWKAADLESLDERIEFSRGPRNMLAQRTFSEGTVGALREVVGQCRAVALFNDEAADVTEGWSRVQVGTLVAGRVMAVIQPPGQELQVVFQPGVLATRSALVMSEIQEQTAASDADTAGVTNSNVPNIQVPESKYLYQMKLTR